MEKAGKKRKKPAKKQGSRLRIEEIPLDLYEQYVLGSAGINFGSSTTTEKPPPPPTTTSNKEKGRITATKITPTATTELPCNRFKNANYDLQKPLLVAMEKEVVDYLRSSIVVGHETFTKKGIVVIAENSHLGTNQRWVSPILIIARMKETKLDAELQEAAEQFFRCGWNVLFLSDASQKSLVRNLVETDSLYLLSMLLYSALYVAPNVIDRDRDCAAALNSLAKYVVETAFTTVKRSNLLRMLGSFLDQTLFPATKRELLNDLFARNPLFAVEAIQSGSFGFKSTDNKYDDSEPRRAILPSVELIKKSNFPLDALVAARVEGLKRFQEFDAIRLLYNARRRGAREQNGKPLPILSYQPLAVPGNLIERIPLDVVATQERILSGWSITPTKMATEFVTKHYEDHSMPVKVGDSIAAPGKRGLFASRRIAPRMPIATYLGVLAMKSDAAHYTPADLYREKDGRWGEAELVIQSDPKMLRALGISPERDSPAMFANSSESFNAELLIYHDSDRRELFGYIASVDKEIAPGEEILI